MRKNFSSVIKDTCSQLSRSSYIPYLIAALFLSGCGGGGGGGGNTTTPRNPETVSIFGHAALEGTSLTGAVVAISKIDITQSNESQTRRGKLVSVDIGNFQPTVGADGAFSFQLEPTLLQNETLYSLSLTCPAPVTDSCPLQAALHVVVSGNRLKQGSFAVSVLTEAVYQRLGYYIAAGFKAVELQQEMDALARMILSTDIDGNTEIEYEDVIQWSDSNDDQLKRPAQISQITSLLHESQGTGSISSEVHVLFSPIAANAPTTGQPSLIETYKDHVYFLTSSAKLYSLNISDPLHPVLEGNTPVRDDINQLKISGSKIYLTYQTNQPDDESGIQIIDITDPAKPISQGETPLEGINDRIAINGEFAYVTYTKQASRENPSTSGIHIIDIREATNPKRLQTLPIDSAIMACGIEVKDSYSYITDRDGRMHVLDIAEPGNPKFLNSFGLPGANCDVHENAGFLYVASGDYGLNILSLESPDHPQFIARNASLRWTRRMKVKGAFAYQLDADAGISIVDISNPMKPKLVDIIDFPDAVDDVAISGEFAFVTGQNKSISIVDMKSPLPPLTLGKIEAPSVDVAINGDKAFLLSTSPGLYIADISHTSPPSILSQATNNYNPVSITYSDNHLYFAAGDYFKIVDVTHPAHPAQTRELETPGWKTAVQVSGNYAFLASGSAGLQVYDISDKEHPTFVRGISTPWPVLGVEISDRYAFLACGQAGVQIFDLDNADTAPPIRSIDTPGFSRKIVVNGGFAYIADSEEGIQIVDVSNPAIATKVSAIDTPGIARDLALAKGIAYAADDFAGVQAIDVSDPHHPVLLGPARTNAGAQGVAVSDDKVYVATYYGLEILRAVLPSR